MHKSLTTAVLALLLIASPLMMFGTSNSNIFSKAMAIEEDGSETDSKSFIMTKDELEEKDDSSSDEEKDDSSSDEEKDDSSSDEEKDDSSSDAVQQNQNNEPQQQQQVTQQPQQKNKQLSIISQEEMQQQQYDNFKKLYESIKQKHKEIQILK
jgi:hypothetical protein